MPIELCGKLLLGLKVRLKLLLFLTPGQFWLSGAGLDPAVLLGNWLLRRRAPWWRVRAWLPSCLDLSPLRLQVWILDTSARPARFKFGFHLTVCLPTSPCRACRNGVHRHHDDCECGPETPRGKIITCNCSCCSTCCHCCRKKFYDRRRWTWVAGGWLNLPSDWGDYAALPSLQV